MIRILIGLLALATSSIATSLELHQWAMRVDTGSHYGDRFEAIAVVIDFSGKYQFLDRERTLGMCSSREGVLEAPDLETLRDAATPILSRYRLQPPIVSTCFVSHPPPSTELSFVYSLSDGTRDAFRVAVPGYLCDSEGVYRDVVEFKELLMSLIDRLPGECTDDVAGED